MKRLRSIVSPEKKNRRKRINTDKTKLSSPLLTEKSASTSGTTFPTDLTTEQQSSRTQTSNSTEHEKMNQQQFTEYLVTALAGNEGASALRRALKPLIVEQTAQVTAQTQETLKTLVDTVKAQETKIQYLENEIEELKQMAKRKTVMVTGIEHKSNENLETTMLDLCKNKLNVKLEPTEIDSLSRVKKTKQVIMTFTTYRKKAEVMKARKLLKTKMPSVYINESLTPKQSEIFAETRKLMKEKAINTTWTRDGKVYVKETESSQPIHVTKKEELTKYLKININDLQKQGTEIDA